MKKNKLILLEFNELNFQYINKYLDSNNYKFFKKIIPSSIKTVSENNYHNIEPWIQWVTAHTGKSFQEHKVFHLGETNKNLKQIFEKIESYKYKVGCVSPMNANNNLTNPDYFIPDPWCDTKSDNSIWSRIFTKIFKQTVRDNAKKKITLISYLLLMFVFLRFAKFKNYILYLKLIINSRRKPWLKSLFLDLLIGDFHLFLLKKNQTDFSTIFLNSGAYIMHRYLFSFKKLEQNNSNPLWYIDSKYDPMEDLLEVYDKILEYHLKLNNYKLIVMTGLSQVKYDSNKFYYRLLNHHKFINLLGIKFSNIFPRMSRDFKITFNDEISCANAKKTFLSILVNNKSHFFSVKDISNSELFVTLSYPSEIFESDTISINKKEIKIFEHIIFIAIKNGMHNGTGFFFQNIKKNFNKNEINLESVYNIIDDYFSNKNLN